MQLVADRGRAKTLAVLAAVAAILIQHSNGTHLNAARWKRESQCRRNQFQCDSGKCIEVVLLCDGQIHCDDGSDEFAVVCQRKICPDRAFKCKYGACIDRAGLCNGVQECADGSDEAQCAFRPCGPAGHTPGSSSELGPASGSGSGERCPALTIPSRDIDCNINCRKLDCTQPVPPGTRATVMCRPFYSHKQEESNFETICQLNGEWSRVVTPCKLMPPPTPAGYYFIPGVGYIRPSKEFVAWDVANATCSAEGATLAMPTSLEGAIAFVNILNYGPSGNNVYGLWAWVGATDHVEEGTWISVTGVPLAQMGHHTWSSQTREPNGGTGENCMVVQRSTGHLGDAPCDWKVPYACQLY